MTMHALPISTLIICGLGAWGCYLLLTQHKPTPRRMGTAVASISLAALLSVFPLTGGDSLIASSSFFKTLCFLVPAGCGLAATIAVITCRSPRAALVWLIAAVLANTAMFFVSGAVIPGVMNLILNVGFLGTLLLFAAVPATNDEPPPEPVSPFTWLACAVTAILLAGLLSALPRVVAAESTHGTTVALSEGGFGWSDLGQSLLFDHGISLTVVSLLLFVAIVTVTRMMAGGSSESADQPVEGTPA